MRSTIVPALPESSAPVFVVELFRGRVNVGRVNKHRGGFRRGLRACERRIRSHVDLAVYLVLYLLQLFLRDKSFVNKQRAETFDGVALGIRRALFVGTIELLVVGERVRIGTNDFGVDERGASRLAAILDRALSVSSDSMASVPSHFCM